jgi:hypothetical protein
MYRYTLLRVALIVAAILVWRWAARTHPAIADTGQWASHGGGALVWTAAAILAFYIIACSILIFRARRHGGPDVAMGVGCATMIAIMFLGVAAILAIGIYFHIVWLTTIITLGTVLTFIPIGGGLIVEGFKALKKRWERNRVTRSETPVEK